MRRGNWVVRSATRRLPNGTGNTINRYVRCMASDSGLPPTPIPPMEFCVRPTRRGATCSALCRPGMIGSARWRASAPSNSSFSRCRTCCRGLRACGRHPGRRPQRLLLKHRGHPRRYGSVRMFASSGRKVGTTSLMAATACARAGWRGRPGRGSGRRSASTGNVVFGPNDVAVECFVGKLAKGIDPWLHLPSHIPSRKASAATPWVPQQPVKVRRAGCCEIITSLA